MQTTALVKISMGFFALHTVLYIEPVAVALLSGTPTHPMWFFHIFVCAYLLMQFSTAKKSVFYTIVAYCLVIPTQMLSAEYVPGRALDETIPLISRTLIVFTPLYLAALFLIAGRGFYLAAAPNPSTNKDAVR